MIYGWWLWVGISLHSLRGFCDGTALHRQDIRSLQRPRAAWNVPLCRIHYNGSLQHKTSMAAQCMLLSCKISLQLQLHKVMQTNLAGACAARSDSTCYVLHFLLFGSHPAIQPQLCKPSLTFFSLPYTGGGPYNFLHTAKPRFG